ncbi:MAG: hypothetical protein OXF28_04205, partial [Thaumarchaeota archaeon]|nr:hypothetical protein [Nitrososphaerota archaeon]MCY3976315.1 hypothetical protein [Nitrososphaerota archaeon]
MNRIKKLSLDVLSKHKMHFGTNFVDNKKALDKIAIIRSKSLKNKLAGFITNIIKNEIRNDKFKMDIKSSPSNESPSNESPSNESPS